MTTADPTASSFSYQAQTDDGQRMAGTIDAPDVETATHRLQSLRLRVTEIRPAKEPARSRSIRGDDFLAFNQQLAQLARAGLPIERGLRLIAADLRRGRLARTITRVAEELERGTPLGQAFEKHKTRFPTLYGKLVEAGVRGGNLPGVLLGLGRHLETEQRLRSLLWRTFSYPVMVIIGLLIVAVFLGYEVLPQFQLMYSDFRIVLPAVTQFLLDISRILPAMAIGLIVLILLVPVAWAMLRAAGRDRLILERLVYPLPLVGPVLKASLVARWLDAVRIGVESGLDLPASFALASDATGSTALARDGQAMSENLAVGRPLTSTQTSLLPPTVPAAIEFAAGHNDLPATLETLIELYQRQAELRLEAVPTVLTPLLLIFMAVSAGFLLAALFLPLVTLIQAISGPNK